MLDRRNATAAANKAKESAARQHRETDELEQAKRTLRSRGFRVFDYSVIEPGSEMIMVGGHQLTAAQVIEKASR